MSEKLVKHLHDDIYQIDPKVVKFADDPSKPFCNPRYLFEGEEMGDDGFSDERLDELLQSIQEIGLRQPIELRKIYGFDDKNAAILEGDEEDAIYQVVDGDCRLRTCLRAEMDEIVCRIHENLDDTAADELAWQLSQNSRNFSENTSAMWVKKKRALGASDELILKASGKSSQWLMQMDTLGALDQFCFHAYCNGKVGLRAMLDLATVKDTEVRVSICKEMLEAAEALHLQRAERLKANVAKAEEKVENAEATATAARLLGGGTTENKEEEAKAKLEAANTALEQAKDAEQKHNNTTPQAKTKQLRDAAKNRGVNVTSTFVGKSKIQKCRNIIEAALENEGYNDDAYIGEIADLQLVKIVIDSFFAGEHDIAKIFNKFYLETASLDEDEEDETDVEASLDEDETDVEASLDEDEIDEEEFDEDEIDEEEFDESFAEDEYVE